MLNNAEQQVMWIEHIQHNLMQKLHNRAWAEELARKWVRLDRRTP